MQSASSGAGAEQPLAKKPRLTDDTGGDEEEKPSAWPSPARGSDGSMRLEAAAEGQPVHPATNASGDSRAS